MSDVPHLKPDIHRTILYRCAVVMGFVLGVLMMFALGAIVASVASMIGLDVSAPTVGLVSGFVIPALLTTGIGWVLYRRRQTHSVSSNLYFGVAFCGLVSLALWCFVLAGSWAMNTFPNLGT